MDTESKILRKEIEIEQLKKFIHWYHYPPELDSQLRVQLSDLEKSLEHDREIHKLEAQTSGRKTWRDDAWKYVAVIIVTTFVNQGIPYLFAYL